MVEFLKEGDKFLCTNGHGSVFGEIFMLEDGLYYYSDNHNIGGCYTWHTLKCIQEKLLELNSFKKQKYGFNDHMEPKQHVKPIKIKETQDLVVNFLDEENGDIVCKNDNGSIIGVILKSPLAGYYVYLILNENINIETQKIIEDKTNKLNEENKDEISKNISNELEKMQNARLNKSSSDKDKEEPPYLKEVLNQRQKTHGEFSEGSKTYADPVYLLEKMQNEIEKNEGRKDDKGKAMFSLIPALAEAEVAKVLTFGAAKYGRDNWRFLEDLEIRTMDAALRHISETRLGRKTDNESGLHPIAHAICELLFFLEHELDKNKKQD
jgi:hypothetical protein